MLFHYYLSIKKVVTIYFNKLTSTKIPFLKDTLCQFCWNWPHGFSEDWNVKSLRRQRQITFNQKSVFNVKRYFIQIWISSVWNYPLFFSIFLYINAVARILSFKREWLTRAKGSRLLTRARVYIFVKIKLWCFLFIILVCIHENHRISFVPVEDHVFYAVSIYKNKVISIVRL